MSEAVPRFIQVVHVSRGRVRMRLPWLRKAQAEADAVADRIAAIAGVEEVQVRAFTGSVLCLFAQEQVEVDDLIAAVGRATGIDHVVGLGERPPSPPPVARPGDGHRSSVARALTRSVREINADTLNATDGRLDLGTMAFLAFISAGAAEIVFSRQLPAPPWFNLAWWAVQAFTAYESGDEPEAAGAD